MIKGVKVLKGIKMLETTELNHMLEHYRIDNNLAEKLDGVIPGFARGNVLENKKGFKFKVGDENKEVKVVLMSSAEGTVTVTYANAEGEEKIFGTVVSEDKGKKKLKVYELVDKKVVKILEKEVDDEFLVEIRKQKVDLSQITTQDDCMHGNWCGPGCSGPSAPITKVDACCQKHDKCYGSRVWGACSCDKEIRECLAPLLNGSEWANIIFTYFAYSPCIPFV